MIQFAAPHRVDYGGALNQFIPGQGKDSTFRKACDCVVGTTNTLEKTGDRTSRTQLADKVNVANINAEFK